MQWRLTIFARRDFYATWRSTFFPLSNSQITFVRFKSVFTTAEILTISKQVFSANTRHAILEWSMNRDDCEVFGLWCWFSLKVNRKSINSNMIFELTHDKISCTWTPNFRVRISTQNFDSRPGSDSWLKYSRCLSNFLAWNFLIF